jgi:hypothetical protein
MKNFNNPIGNRTRDLPAYTAVFQVTVPQRTPSLPLTFVRLLELGINYVTTLKILPIDIN